MSGRFLVILLCAVAVASVEASQQRDTPLAPTTGSGAITGQVVSDETTPRPIRRAIVTISGDLPASRTAITDDEGRFTFRSLPAGRFSITATKTAYLPASYGALRPGRLGTALQIAQGQQATVTIRIARGGVISGVLRDRNGAPMLGVPVMAAPARSVSSTGPPPNSSGPEPIAVTDDRGMYRLFGLAPGDYVVSATPRIGGSGVIGSRSTEEVDALFADLIVRRRTGAGAPTSRPAPLIPDPPAVGFAAVYYPGTPLPQEAAPIKIGVGEERAGVDFTVVPVRTSTLDGQVSGSIPNLAVTQISIVIGGRRGVSSQDLNPILSLPPGPDGSFRFTNVSPGHYTLMARADRNQTAPAAPLNGSSSGTTMGPGPAPTGRPDYFYAVVDLDVRGEDMTGLTLALQPGSTFTGRIRFDGATQPQPADLTGLRVGLSPPGGGTYYMTTGSTIIGNTFSAVPAFVIGPDGSFAGSYIAPGTYTLTSTLPAGLQQKWWLQSAMAKGRDLLDGPVQVLPGETFSDVVLTFSDQHSELSGALQSFAGVAAPEYFVVVFPEDRAMWAANARRIQSTRPGTDGKFSVRDLPAGDYLLAALIDLEPADLNDPKLLEALVASAVRVRLADGERKQQDLKVMR